MDYQHARVDENVVRFDIVCMGAKLYTTWNHTCLGLNLDYLNLPSETSLHSIEAFRLHQESTELYRIQYTTNQLIHSVNW